MKCLLFVAGTRLQSQLPSPTPVISLTQLFRIEIYYFVRIRLSLVYKTDHTLDKILKAGEVP
jgi:hypothetical protein